ncbi:hypothetical protein Srufu_003450 [Streptomyces libani subsp. rufus]|nr:hypothetical protein Srufu_003450 [Streptomyces libani subsp. rufus]
MGRSGGGAMSKACEGAGEWRGVRGITAAGAGAGPRGGIARAGKTFVMHVSVSCGSARHPSTA